MKRGADFTRGHMWTDWWVDCGECGYMLCVSPPANATPRQEAERIGWRWTRRHGWRCPEHAGTAGEEQQP